MTNYVKNNDFLALISGKTMVPWKPYNVPLVLQTYVLLQQCQILNTMSISLEKCHFIVNLQCWQG